jgi:hypothetical protein
MTSFASQVNAFTKTATLQMALADLLFKQRFAQMVISRTRIAEPLSWIRPDPSHIPGAMRGNWRMGSTRYAYKFNPSLRNTTAVVPSNELRKIKPLKNFYMTNPTPYASVYEPIDGALANAIANAPALMRQAIRDAQKQKGGLS